MSHDAAAFGAVLRQLRIAAALSQEALAARAGLSEPVIRWEYFLIAAIENLIYFALAVGFFEFMYRRSRQTGQFARNEE